MNALAKAFTRLHARLYKLSKGKRFTMGGAVALLTTTGAKSGRQRTTPLMYLEHEGGYLLAASMAGSDKHPAWYHNLKQTPACRLQIGDRVIACTATVAGPQERDALYQRFIDARKDFAAYEAKTSRVIPVLKLTPV